MHNEKSQNRLNEIIKEINLLCDLIQNAHYSLSDDMALFSNRNEITLNISMPEQEVVEIDACHRPHLRIIHGGLSK